jgi:hypothetical protein
VLRGSVAVLQLHVVASGRQEHLLFVATDGRIRGAQLEAALRHLREHNAVAQRASDMQLAQAILALRPRGFGRARGCGRRCSCGAARDRRRRHCSSTRSTVR